VVSGYSSVEKFTGICSRSVDSARPHTRGRFHHLYINGRCWGLYQTEERPEANYGESYLGGDDADYDAGNGSTTDPDRSDPLPDSPLCLSVIYLD